METTGTLFGPKSLEILHPIFNDIDGLILYASIFKVILYPYATRSVGLPKDTDSLSHIFSSGVLESGSDTLFARISFRGQLLWGILLRWAPIEDQNI